MIYIDFIGGAHGNYLEFVCNKFLAGVPCNDLPFGRLGSSHAKLYYGEKQFQCWHYTDHRGVHTELFDSKIISIQVEYEDMLPLQLVSLLRAGDWNIDKNQLEIDTYHKLNNGDYKGVLDTLSTKFFQSQVQESYNAVKDVSWPNITSIEDFDRLPEEIRLECIHQHNLKLFQFDAEHPDCPRHILREFFKIGFRDPEQSEFMQFKKKQVYNSSNEPRVFPFASFYNTDNFINQIHLIGEWCGWEVKNMPQLINLHNEFLSRQPFKDSKKFCDELIKRICNQEIFDLPELDLIQEGYIDSQLENHYGRELPADQVKWFTNSQQILNFFLK